MRLSLGTALFTAVLLIFQTGCDKGVINERAVKAAVDQTILAIEPFTVREGSGNSYLFTLTRAAPADVTFTWLIGAGADDPGPRFSALTGSVTIPKGATSATQIIPLIDDGVAQLTQTFTLTLASAATDVTLVPAVPFTVLDDEDVPRVRFGSPAQSVPEAAGSARVTITLSGPSATATTVDFDVAGTATVGADYTYAPPSPLTFAPGETSKFVDVSIVDDFVPEPNETVDLTLTAVTSGHAVIDAVALAHRLTIANDDFQPVVLAVTSTLADGAYRTGTVPVTVRFSRPVDVTGTPRLTLETGATDRDAVYVGGSGTDLLIFEYAIQPGDRSADLEYVATTSLNLAGGTIRGSSDGLNGILDLPTPGATGSLGAAKALVIDTVRPDIVNVTSAKPNGSYTVGERIEIIVTLSEPVRVTGSGPRLGLATGPTTRDAAYAGGDGTATLTFNYDVGAGDVSSDLDARSTNAFDLNGGTVRDVAGNDADVTLPAPGAAGSLGANKNVIIDTAVPVVVGVSSTLANGYYRAGQVVPITMTFSEIIFVAGTPQLTLATGSVDRVVDYASGSGGATLTFNYVVQPGDAASPLDYRTAGALRLNGGTIRDGALNAATLTLPAPGGTGSLGVAKTIVIDTEAPRVTALMANADGAYRAGRSVDVRVAFSELVVVGGGTPRLTLEMGTTDRAVALSGGSNSSTLTFTYLVQAGDYSADLDVIGANALDPNGSVIADRAGNVAVVTLPAPGAPNSLSANQNVVIDTEAPAVLDVTSTKTDGAYTTGAIVDVTVRLTEAVTVTGTPRLNLTTGAGRTTAVDLFAGSGTNTLTFRYVVAPGDQSNDLDYADAAALSLNGGSIADPAGNAAVTTLPAPGAAGSLGANKNLVIDTQAPTVVNVTSTAADGGYRAGASLAITVQFSEPVYVTGSPRLTLETGAIDRALTNPTGSGSNTLTFTYVVTAGDQSLDLDYHDVAALIANGGTVRDVAANDAVPTLPAPGAAGSLGFNKQILIDTQIPTITSIGAVTADGYYRVGAIIDVTVNFSEPVVVTGSPTLTLETGATDRAAAYRGGSGAATLTFRYVVQAGDTAADLDVVGANAFSLAGGSVRDAVGNDADVTVPAPGAANSLGLARAIVVDTTNPTAPATIDDGTWTTSLADTPNVTWTASTDVTSGVLRYEFALGTSAGGTEVVNWTSNGAALSRVQSGLNLTEGTRYYASVRAVDRALNISTITTGDGFRPDVTLPTTPASLNDGLTSPSITQTPPLSWTAATDALSGVARYQIAIGSTAGASDVMTWSDFGLVTSITVTSLTLTEGSYYFASVRAVDQAGNVGAARAGDGWLIGWLNQAYVKGSTTTAQANGGSAIAISGDTMVVGAPGGSGAVIVYVRSGATWSQQAYLTAGNADNGDRFGAAVAIDGDTLVIGAPGEDSLSSTIGTNVTFLNNLSTDSGAAYIYVRSGTTWALQAFAKASNEDNDDAYGTSVAISGDTVVIGAPGEASNQTGASTSASTNNSSAGAGAAYVLRRSGTTWTQGAYLKQAVVRAGSKFGASVAVGSDTVLVGAPGDAAAAQGVTNGTGAANGAGSVNSGAAYVFRQAGSTLTQEAYFKASNAAAGANFGTSVAVSGNSAVVGAPGEATNGTAAGAAYVFARSTVTWTEDAYLKPTRNDANDAFGTSVAIDQTFVLIGAPGEASAQATVGQVSATSPDNSAAGAGAAYLFRRRGATWSPLAYLKAPNVDAGDAFGTSVALFGSTLVAGAPLEDSNQTTVTNGGTASANNGAANSGAGYVFFR